MDAERPQFASARACTCNVGLVVAAKALIGLDKEKTLAKPVAKLVYRPVESKRGQTWEIYTKADHEGYYLRCKITRSILRGGTLSK